MHRLLIGLGSLILVAVWDGIALVHAVPSTVPDFVVEGILTMEGRDVSEGMFTLTNNTTHFSVKAFAVTLGNALIADTTVRGWTAQATGDYVSHGLPGASGGVNDTNEYVFYTACDFNDVCGPFLGQGTEDGFTLSIQGLFLSPAP